MRLILTLPGLVVVLSVFTSSPSRPFLFIDEVRTDEVHPHTTWLGRRPKCLHLIAQPAVPVPR